MNTRKLEKKKICQEEEKKKIAVWFLNMLNVFRPDDKPEGNFFW